jgi:hypothetical protein
MIKLCSVSPPPPQNPAPEPLSPWCCLGTQTIGLTSL